MRKALLLLFAVSMTMLAPVAASAQFNFDDYIGPIGPPGPPGPSGPAGPPGAPGAVPCNVVIDLGTMTEGQTRSTNASCPFQAGGAVGLALNGVAYGQTNANGAGVVPVAVTFVSDGVAVARPVLAAAGIHLAQAGVVVRINANGVVNDRAALIGSNSLRLTGMGANGVQGTVTILFNLVRGGAGGAAGAGGLPRTGAMILRWAGAGTGLLAVGVVLMMIDRRRRRSFGATA